MCVCARVCVYVYVCVCVRVCVCSQLLPHCCSIQEVKDMSRLLKEYPQYQRALNEHSLHVNLAGL